MENGEAPPPRYEQAISPEILAGLAYQHMQLPDTKVTLAPAANTKVNLPTWAWLDKAVFDEVQATAALNADGSIGEPYAQGKSTQTPPCGLRYLRSSGDGTYKLRATITWDITWTGTGGAGGDLPDGTFGSEQAITVQEIQAVNR